MRVLPVVLCLTVVMAAGTSCRPTTRAPMEVAANQPGDPCRSALAPLASRGPLSDEIATMQQRAAGKRSSEPALEQLGYLFVTRARLSHDEGLYEAALETASCLERRNASNDQARLLRGHVRHQQHRFAEAEALGRTLVVSRGLALDFALLGDALMEQGRLAEAADAYQHMIDIKPYYQSYTRAAHLRWLRGNLDGAIDLMQKAVSAASPRDPEAVVWARTRLADYYLQARRFDEALAECEAALQARPGYSPALVARARVRLARGGISEAVSSLRAAETVNPQPDVRWLLADALRAASREDDAREIEQALVRDGAARDPRTLALYLSTRGERLDQAIALARGELGVRADVFTYDALAWALARAGRVGDAEPHMDRALAEGTADGRLFLHGGVIAAASGHRTRARELLGRAQTLAHMLLPSERLVLADARARLRGLAGDGPRRLQERNNP
jgi:tetratricopeptide (TPR) repeat protein